MIIRKGEWFIRLPEPVDPRHVELMVWVGGGPSRNPDALCYPATRISPEDFEAIRSSKKKTADYIGRPSLFSVLDAVSIIGIHPTADQDYYAELEFNPPRKRI